MSSRAPRQLWAASIRASARSSKSNVSQSLRASRRNMSSTAETAKKGSDLPWIIGSAAVFGPAFIYLVSPAARKTAPHHHDSHGKHGEKGHGHEEPVLMKDDEGTEADVADSVKKAEADDVPKSDGADKEDKEEDKPEEKTQPAVTPDEEAKKDPEPVPKDPAGSKADDGPTEQGQVRGAAAEPNPESPKSVDEKVNEEKKDSEKKDGESS